MTVIVPYAADVADRIRLAVVGGYDSAERIIESLAELIEYDPDAADDVAALGVPLREHIAGLVEAAFEAHRLAEAEFPRVPDCDSISAVLSELERSGILAGEDVGMTMSDVRDDMRAVVDESGRRGQEPRGWVAFHRQDVERAIEAGVLCLAYAGAVPVANDTGLTDHSMGRSGPGGSSPIAGFAAATIPSFWMARGRGLRSAGSCA